MRTAILIPARYASTRFPAKPLAILDNQTMIQRVAEKCMSSGIDTYVLTDNRTIGMAAKALGIKVYIDTKEYENGTERCAGAIRSSLFDSYDTFINVQGDMPDVTHEMIEKAIMGLKYYTTSTVFTTMPEEKQNDPSSVKMVRAGDQALWFGRGITGYGDWHLGVYGYRRNALEMYPTLEVEREEEVEKLEQLRWLKSGWQMACYHVQFNGVEINTPEDVEEWHAKQTH